MIGVEVCINCDGRQSVSSAVEAARLGGASSIELCRAMEYDGLTPPERHIVEARAAFRDRRGLMVMIRPRKGDFHFSRHEIHAMRDQIESAAKLGTDGVVFGVLRKNDDSVAGDELNELMETCSKHGLLSTFHRAFDATPNLLEALDVLIGAGVDRVLASGSKWPARRSAMDGLENLKNLAGHAQNRIEIVVGGGINLQNIDRMANGLPVRSARISFHSYSGVQEEGVVTQNAVNKLVRAVNSIGPELSQGDHFIARDQEIPGDH